MSAAEDRLRAVPWRALAGIAVSLDAPISEILAGASAERVVDRTLRALSPLDRARRAAVAEALFGIALWRVRLAYHLGVDPTETGPLSVHPERSEAESLPVRPERSEAESKGRSNLARRLLGALVRDLGGVPDAEVIVGLPDGTLPPPRPPPADLATRYSVPAWLADVLAAERGPEAAALADALDRPGPICLRPNQLRIDAAALAEALAAEGVATRPGRLVPTARLVTSAQPNLYGLRAWHDALFEVQDEASQLAGALVGAGRGDTVLDLCAGAGGKALQLAAAVGSTGMVYAVDPDAERLTRLATRARRAGADGIVRILGPTAPSELQVDRVLVDAPCSELGVLRRGPDQRFRIDPASFPAVERLQLEILARAAAHVRRGGTLVYATCTIRRQEDEAIAEAFTLVHRGFLLRDQRRTWPDRDGSDGFFIASWQRAA